MYMYFPINNSVSVVERNTILHAVGEVAKGMKMSSEGRIQNSRCHGIRNRYMYRLYTEVEVVMAFINTEGEARGCLLP